jgi:hypothetical protein
LYVLVEGQTEEQFVKEVLASYLQGLGVWVYPIVVETSRDAFGRKRHGGGQWRHWKRDLMRLRQQGGKDVRITTMFDLPGCTGRSGRDRQPDGSSRNDPPEDINDGLHTAPSKRLMTSIAGYRKTVHGPLAVTAAGLPALRRACPRFGSWVTRLEAFGAERS